MSRHNFYLFALLTFILLACDRNITESINISEVEAYIEQLRKGEYDSKELPAFTSQDISALLEYRNETQPITDFPVNMISSFAIAECSLGMYVLWTIESIRAVATESEYLIGRFPSLNPIVQKRQEPSESEDGSQSIVAQAYFTWWNDNRTKPFDEFKHVDPLLETDYRWR